MNHGFAILTIAIILVLVTSNNSFAAMVTKVCQNRFFQFWYGWVTLNIPVIPSLPKKNLCCHVFAI